jgi:hypothetical protein
VLVRTSSNLPDQHAFCKTDHTNLTNIIHVFYLFHHTVENVATDNKLTQQKQSKKELGGGRGKICYGSMRDKPTILNEEYFIWQKFTDVSEEHAASIFRVEE